jgi:ligand-binding SRPBCC domain-containing protein
MAVFEAALDLPCLPQRLFDFLLRPANVARISDPRLGLTFTDAPEVVALGSRIVFQVQGFGVVQTIEHKIVELDDPWLIVEEQVKGPMKAWRHEHVLESIDVGTRMIDRVIFEPPGGMLGFLVKESKILESLEDGFIHREEELQRLAARGGLG